MTDVGKTPAENGLTTRSDSHRIVHLSSFDRLGGAAIAACRLHQSLLEHGLRSRMLVGRQTSTMHPTTPALGARPFSRVFRYLGGVQRRLAVSLGIPYDDFRPGWPLLPWYSPKIDEGEIVHCHWVSDGFVPLGRLERLANPLVLTLHDMWFFTGGCHHSFVCSQYKNGCSMCPMIRKNPSRQVARDGWQKRLRLFKRKRPHVICPSRWLAERFAESPFAEYSDVSVIPNTLDPRIFKPGDKRRARSKLGIPQDAKVLAFNAFNVSVPVKGWPFLRESLRILSGTTRDPVALIIGHSDSARKEGLPIRSIWTGPIEQEDAMPDLLAASDAFVISSLRENLPNTVAEALACGVPCAGFAVGGIPEMIQDGTTGMLAQPEDAQALASAIIACIEGSDRMAEGCRSFAEKTYGDNASLRHIELYSKIRREASRDA